MKFLYEYRTSDNQKRNGSVNAADRDAAFRTLKAQGIRPSRLEDAPGLFNKLFGKGKRWMAIVVLALSAAVLGAVLWTRDGSTDPYVRRGLAREISRRQIWGDEAIIASAIKRNWLVVFKNPADRLLSLFAQPGKEVRLPMIPSTIEQDFAKALEEPMRIEPTDLEEYRQMKCIVAGMKKELREYLADGGTIRSYVLRLVERQKEEVQILSRESYAIEQAVRIGNADARLLWGQTNVRLRALGLPTISFPEALERQNQENSKK